MVAESGVDRDMRIGARDLLLEGYIYREPIARGKGLLAVAGYPFSTGTYPGPGIRHHVYE